MRRKDRPGIFKRRPLRSFLRERSTLIIERPLLGSRKASVKEESVESRKPEPSKGIVRALAERDIVDLVRSQFDFACSICEDIAEKVSSKLPSRVEKTRVYEAVYKLSSGDKKAQTEAVETLGELNVLKDVMTEIKQGWESLKAEK